MMSWQLVPILLILIMAAAAADVLLLPISNARRRVLREAIVNVLRYLGSLLHHRP
jgi:hypothetical protein